MADDQFDLLTKALAVGSSRRYFFKVLAAATAGGTLAALGLARAYAADSSLVAKVKPGGAGHGCTSDAQCKSGVCCLGHCCASGKCCSRGACFDGGDCG